MRANDMYEACADALRAYAEGAGFTDMVVGLSGGIDSAVTSALYTDILGPQNVLLVNMPGRTIPALPKIWRLKPHRHLKQTIW